RFQMVKTPVAQSKKKSSATPAASEKENVQVANGKPAVDRYAELGKKKSAFAALSAEAKQLAAAAPPIKEGAVPVGMRRSDKKNRSRYNDGIAVEPVAIHRNGDAKETKAPKSEFPMKTKSVKEMKAEMAKRVNKEQAKSPEKPKKNEKRRREEDYDEEEQHQDASFIMKRMQQLANAEMEREICKNKSKRARNSPPPSDERLAVVPHANGRAFTGTPHPASKKSRLSSGVTVEKKMTFDVEEMPYVVEEPSDDSESMGGGRRLSKKKKHYSSQELAAFNREMDAEDPYRESDDDDFEARSIDLESQGLTDEELEEVFTDDMSGEDEEEDEEDDEEMSDEEVDVSDDEELVSSEVDEEDVSIRPEDIQRTITFDDDNVEPEDSDEDEEDEDEEEECMDECCEEGEENGCCDDSDCEENGCEMGSEGSGTGEEYSTSDSSHVSDDSYGEAFVDDEMAAKSVTIHRQTPAKNKKKGAKAAAAPIDFTAFPFKDTDSSISASKALDYLLSPCGVQEFFDDHFQSTSLVIRRNDPAYYGNLFSTSAMTSLLREHTLEYGTNINVALYSGGVRTTHNGEGRAYPLVIGDAIRSGCSVQITNPQSFSTPVWYLCDTLQECFHCFVGANTYLTPMGASGFAPHWDEIDAFLLQVEGRKYWRVWAPESAEDELPLESSGNFSESDMAGRTPAFEGWVEQGDLLYIPRGFTHQARTCDKTHSLHVTVSVGRQWTAANLLQKLLPPALEAFTAARTKLRRQLPPGLLDMTGVADLPGEYPLEEAAESKLLDPLDRHVSQFRQFVAQMRESGIDLMAREFMRTALPPVLTHEEKQLSALGNEDADLFEEKGASRITSTSEVRFIRRHGQRLLFETAETPFVVHRMANSRVYEGSAERQFTLTPQEEPAFAELLSAYPEWTSVSELKMKKKAKIEFLTKLFNNGLIMARSA
ncbi:hypothetical protein PMAYCL1PPCAC_28061, partial [Pristionchus mayeri]